MADIVKYTPLNGGIFLSYLKTNFSFFRPTKTVSFLIFISIAFTIFLAFTPSFTDLVALTNSSSPSSLLSHDSHLSSIVFCFFPNSSSNPNSTHQPITNHTLIGDEFLKTNQTTTVNSASLVKNVAAQVDYSKVLNELSECDLFDGNWVRDESYPLYEPGSCSLIDEQFNCFLNGRPDNTYLKHKWKPKACNLPRFVN